MSDSSITGNLPLSGAADLQAQSTVKETQKNQTVIIGGHKYNVTNNNLPTKNVSTVVEKIRANLSNMDATSQKNVEKYATGRAEVAGKKVAQFDKILSTPLLGKIVQKIVTLLSVILPKQIQPGQLQDIKFATEWKKERAEYKQLAGEVALKNMPVANTKLASTFVNVNESYINKKNDITKFEEAANDPSRTQGFRDGQAGRANQAREGLIKEERRLVASNFEEFSTNLISQIPNVATNKTLNSSSMPNKSDLNNNGLSIKKENLTITIGESAKIDRDDIEVPLLVVEKAIINGEELTMYKNKAFYDEASGMLYMDREDARYHDHVIVSGGEGKPSVMSLADGSGHGENARPMAKSIAEVAHNYVSEKINDCRDLHEMLKAQMEGLKIANDQAAEQNIEGQTTFIQTALIGNILSGIAVGDSKLFVFRSQQEGGWACLDPLKNSKGTLDAKDAGGQLSGRQEDNGAATELNTTQAFAMALEEGDVVFMCSDGFVDNFNPSINKAHPDEIDANTDSKEWILNDPAHLKIAQEYSQKTITDQIKNCKTGKEINDALKSFIQDNTREKKVEFLTNPNKETEKTYKGKLDDAASCFMLYTSKK